VISGAATGMDEMAGPTICEKWWNEIRASFDRHRDVLIAVHLGANG
jgi:hypothetical protein